MADDRVEPPEQPKTTQMPVVPQWAIELTQAMKDGFRQTNANIELVSSDLGLLKSRVDILETERSKYSGGLRGLSTSDAEQAAQLAQERAAREALATEHAVTKKTVEEIAVNQAALAKTNDTQLAILARLDKVASNPMVKTVVTILVTILGTWAASKGISVKP